MTVLMVCFLSQWTFGGEEIAGETSGAVEKIQVKISCMDGNTFPISVVNTATVKELKDKIAKSREDIYAIAIELFVKSNEDALADGIRISVFGIEGQKATQQRSKAKKKRNAPDKKSHEGPYGTS